MPMRSQEGVLIHKRQYGHRQCLIALNISSEPRRVHWQGKGTLMLSTYLDKEELTVKTPLILRGDEGVILKLGELGHT